MMLGEVGILRSTRKSIGGGIDGGVGGISRQIEHSSGVAGAAVGNGDDGRGTIGGAVQ